jgi:hypothetical protein
VLQPENLPKPQAKYGGETGFESVDGTAADIPPAPPGNGDLGSF